MQKKEKTKLSSEALAKLKDLIIDFLTKHRSIIYEPSDLQLAMIAHNYEVYEDVGVSPEIFAKAVDELVAEGKIQRYVRLA